MKALTVPDAVNGNMTVDANSVPVDGNPDEANSVTK